MIKHDLIEKECKQVYLAKQKAFQLFLLMCLRVNRIMNLYQATKLFKKQFSEQGSL